jgi:hypothetical protein
MQTWRSQDLHDDQGGPWTPAVYSYPNLASLIRRSGGRSFLTAVLRVGKIIDAKQTWRSQDLHDDQGGPWTPAIYCYPNLASLTRRSGGRSFLTAVLRVGKIIDAKQTWRSQDLHDDAEWYPARCMLMNCTGGTAYRGPGCAPPSMKLH